MRTALICMGGTRGDHEPYIALAQEMLRSNKFERIHLTAAQEYAHLIPDNPKISTHLLPTLSFSGLWPKILSKLIKARIAGYFTGNFDPIKSQTSCFTIISSRILPPVASTLTEIAQKEQPDIIISALGLTPVTVCIARSLRVPLWLISPQPNVPTTSYPYYNTGVRNAILASEEIARMLDPQCSQIPKSSYKDTFTLQWGFFESALENLESCYEALQVPKLTMNDLEKVFHGEMPGVYLMNSYPEQLVPRSPEWPRSIFQVPPFADDYLPPGWRAEVECPKVFEYLACLEEKPFCVTFGSMPVLKKRAASRALLIALRSAGVSQVLMLKGLADLGPHRLSCYDRKLKEWADDHVFFCDEKPQFKWLFPQCSGVICHGGAGTIFAGLRAGLAPVVSPVLCDQFLWGGICKSLGIGAVAGPRLEDASAASFKIALETVSQKEVQDRVSKLGKEMQKQSGSKIAAELFATVGCKDSAFS